MNVHGPQSSDDTRIQPEPVTVMKHRTRSKNCNPVVRGVIVIVSPTCALVALRSSAYETGCHWGAGTVEW